MTTISKKSPPSLFSRITDLFKPHRNEATLRFKNTAYTLSSLIFLSYILPVPSFWTSIAVVVFSRATTAFWWYLCVAELAILALLLVNMLQAAYAIKYPRAPFTPISSPARPSGIKSPPAKRRLQALSANTSPQLQQSFSSSYASSPISTPPRVLNYSVPSPSPSRFDTSISSSASSLPPSPSPILSAYRSNHSLSIGQALDGALLSRLTGEESESDDD